MSHLAGSGFAYFAVLASVFVTAFYAFRQYFIVFHGKERWREAKHDAHHGDEHHHDLSPNDNPHESPWVVTFSAGVFGDSVCTSSALLTIEPLLYGDFFKGVIFVNHEAHPCDAPHERGISRRDGDGVAQPCFARVVSGDCGRGGGVAVVCCQAQSACQVSGCL